LPGSPTRLRLAVVLSRHGPSSGSQQTLWLGIRPEGSGCRRPLIPAFPSLVCAKVQRDIALPVTAMYDK